MLDFSKRHRDHSQRQETPTMQSPTLEVLNPQDKLNFLGLKFLVHQLHSTLYVNIIQSGPRKRKSAFRFARVLVIFSLVSVCILRRVSEQLVNSRAVTILRYTRSFFSNATPCPFVDFVVLPRGHGRSVTDF